MKRQFQTLIHDYIRPLGPLCLLALLPFGAAVAQDSYETQTAPPVAHVTIGDVFIDVEPAVDFERATLRVAGPDDYALTKSISAESGEYYLTADLLMEAESVRGASGELSPRVDLADGRYYYEVEFVAGDGSMKRETGAFLIQDGIALQGASGEPLSQAEPQRPGLLARIAGTVLDVFVPSAHAQSGDFDDFVSIRNTTGTSSSRLNLNSSDSIVIDADSWRLINDDGQGHRFDITEGTAGARLSIIQGGEVGIGTTTPQDQLHINDSNGFQFRLEENGYTTRFDTFGERFAIYQANPRQFVLENNAPTNSLFIDASGNIGAGGAPTEALHVQRSDNTARIQVEETGTASPQVLFSLIKAGYPQFQLQNTAQTDFNWTFRLAGNAGTTERFEITKIGTGGAEFELYGDGSATFRGDVTANGVLLTSTREAKTDFRDIDERDVLEKLASLEISEWRYKDEAEGTAHIGPVAEEFHEVFGLSDGKRLNMIDTNGIAFAAIQALHNENQALKDRLAALEERLGQ